MILSPCSRNHYYSHAVWQTICSLVCLAMLSFSAAQAEELQYQTTDPDLKVITLDSAPTESFLAVKVDSEGRIFVGGREQLFVYEPLANGKYGPRTSLVSLPGHSWIYDIEIRGNDVYILTVSALYVLPDARIKRDGLTIKRLVWGVPLGHVHQCFHGMTWGPDGDLYLASGDPLWYYGDFNRPDHWGHWTMFSQPENSQNGLVSSHQVQTPYNGVGAVFRCRPNGSRLQVVSRGLRNSCGLTFDKNWNLFTNDNDHESMPAEYVPGRLNHVTPHSYFSWPRGWMLDKTPDRKDLLDTLITTLGRAVPVGQWYYNDSFLPKKYRGALLVARWCTRKVTYYPLRQHGSTFKCDEHELLVGRDQARPVGVTVGRGGRVFATICYMAQNEGSPIYKSDLVMVTRKDDPESLPFDGFDITTAGMDRLLQELALPDWSRRYLAHVELQRRSAVLPTKIVELTAKSPDNNPALKHLPWLLASKPSEAGAEVLKKLANEHSDPNVRLQALRAYGSLPAELTSDKSVLLTRWLKDESPQIRHTAVTLCFDGTGPIAPEHLAEIVAGPAVSDDTYQRQAATLLIAERGTFDTIGNLCQNEEPKVRLAGVLAAGARLTLPKVDAALADDLPLAPWRAEDAYLIQFADVPNKVDLRSVNSKIGLYTVADHWKAGKRTSEQEQLFGLLEVRLADENEDVRSQAAYFLSLLNDARTEPLIARIRTDITQRKLSLAGLNAVTKAWIIGPFDDYEKSFKTIHAPEKSVLDPAATYRSGNLQLGWRPVTITRQINFREIFGPNDDKSFYTMIRLESGTKQPAILGVGSDDGVKVWHNGKAIWTNETNRGALPLQDSIPLELQPGSNDILIRVHNIDGESGLYLHYRALQPVVASLPEKIEANGFAARLRDAAAGGNSVKVDPKFFDIDWSDAAKSGNIENGKKLFAANGLGCAKCHAVTADAAINAGPSLADAAKRFSVPHLVESVLIPGKQISPVFKATLIVTKDGKQALGLVTGETAEKLELILTDATKLTIPITEIEERKLQEASPMPQGLVKTPEELRDLLAYLLAS